MHSLTKISLKLQSHEGGQQTDIENRLVVAKSLGEGRDGLGAWDSQMQIIICRKDKKQGPTVQLIKPSGQFSSVAQSCLTLCDPMDCSTPGLPVHHQLPEFTQTHVH